MALCAVCRHAPFDQAVNDAVIAHDCGREFHRACIMRLLEGKDTRCPHCHGQFYIEVDENELMERTEPPNADNPFTRTFSVIEGTQIKHGPYIETFRDGMIRAFGSYIAGARHGPFTYWANAQFMDKEELYDHGMLIEGKKFERDKNGKAVLAGWESQTEKVYFITGDGEERGYSKDHLIYFERSAAGKMKKIEAYSGQDAPYTKEYNGAGTLICHKRPTGYCRWYDTGILKEEADYDELRQQHGTTRFFAADGSLQRTETWCHGVKLN